MKPNQRQWFEHRVRTALLSSLFLMESGRNYETAMVYAMLAVHRLAEHVDLDVLERRIHDMTDHGDVA